MADSSFLYNWNGLPLEVEYTFYDAEEGQPVICIDIESITDPNGRPIEVPRTEMPKIIRAVYRHLRAETRREWQEIRARYQTESSGILPTNVCG